MKKYLALIILPVFFIAGCESEQAGQPLNSTNQPASSSTAMSTETGAAQNATEMNTSDSATTSTQMAQADTASAAKQEPRSGEQVYQQYCGTCHKTGVANAPKFADKAAWEPRIAKGKDVLYQSAINGVAGTAMTPKGSCMNCSDDELKAAVDYIVANVQ